MSFWTDLDPTGNNFLGLGPSLGRVLAGVGTAGGSEFHRTDPFKTAQGSPANHMGRALGGIGPGAVGGFVTGGVPGAIVGGIGGGAAAGSGATNNSTLSGFGENLGIGAGAGGLAGYLAGTGLAGSLGSGGSGAASSGGSASSSSPFSISKLISSGMNSGGQTPAAQGDPLADSLQQVSNNNNLYQQAIQNNFRRSMSMY